MKTALRLAIATIHVLFSVAPAFAHAPRHARVAPKHERAPAVAHIQYVTLDFMLKTFAAQAKQLRAQHSVVVAQR